MLINTFVYILIIKPQVLLKKFSMSAKVSEINNLVFFIDAINQQKIAPNM